MMRRFLQMRCLIWCMFDTIFALHSSYEGSEDRLDRPSPARKDDLAMRHEECLALPVDLHSVDDLSRGRYLDSRPLSSTAGDSCHDPFRC